MVFSRWRQPHLGEPGRQNALILGYGTSPGLSLSIETRGVAHGPRARTGLVRRGERDLFRAHGVWGACNARQGMIQISLSACFADYASC